MDRQYYSILFAAVIFWVALIFAAHSHSKPEKKTTCKGSPYKCFKWVNNEQRN